MLWRSMASFIGCTLALASYGVRALAGKAAQRWFDTSLGIGDLHGSVDRSVESGPAVAATAEVDMESVFTCHQDTVF